MSRSKNSPRHQFALRTLPLPAAVAAALGAMPNVGDAQERPEEIIVTSSLLEQPRRQIATAVSVIDFEEIELRGYNDLQEVLRTQPGIGVSNSGGPGKATTVRIRGEEGYRTVLLIDGIKAVDVSATQTAPNFDGMLATNDIQRVEVLRGPQGFMYGADAGGVVNVITGRGDGPLGGRVGLETGEFRTTKIDANITGGGDKGDYFFSVADLDTDGFNAQTTDTVLRDDDGASNTTLHAKLGFNAGENVRLQLVARDVDATTLYDGCFSSITFSTVHDCVGTTEQSMYRATVEQRGDKFSNTFGYSSILNDRDNFTESISSFAAKGELNRVEYMGAFKASEAHTIAYGIDLEQDEFRNATTVQQRDQDGYYFEYQGAYADRFSSAGARYDDNEDFGTHTSTRLSAAYVQDLDGGNSLKYRASVGTGFRAPSLFEINYNRRAPASVHPLALATPLVEEQSEGYDIGVDFTADSGLRFEVTYFDQEIQDQISYVSISGPFRDGYVQTPGISKSDGIELGVEAPVGERWAVLANVTNNDAKTATGAARLRRPENLGNIGARFTSASEALSLMANYRFSYDAIDFGNLALDDYEVLDLSINYAFNETFDVYGRIQNATDEQYVEVNNYNSADRAAYAGVRLKF